MLSGLFPVLAKCVFNLTKKHRNCWDGQVVTCIKYSSLFTASVARLLYCVYSICVHMSYCLPNCVCCLPNSRSKGVVERLQKRFCSWCRTAITTKEQLIRPSLKSKNLFLNPDGWRSLCMCFCLIPAVEQTGGQSPLCPTWWRQRQIFLYNEDSGKH